MKTNLHSCSSNFTGQSVNKAKLKESTYLLDNLEEDEAAMNIIHGDSLMKPKNAYKTLGEQGEKKSM